MQFTLKVEYRAASNVLHMLLLSRLDYMQMKMMYKVVCKTIEEQLFVSESEMLRLMDFDVEAYRERVGDEHGEGDDAHAGGPGGPPKPNSGKRKQGARRKRGGRGGGGR